MSELPDNNRDEARRWLGNVADDLHVMRMVVADPESPARMACFLAHLAVEKALKAVIIDGDVALEKTHNLLVLHDTCLAIGRFHSLDRSLLAACNPWAIDGRYADDMVEADRSTARRLTDFANEVFAQAQRVLGGERGDQ
ncbi:MAG: HEPN domain-containing protein [Acidimicrobiales bacterium]